MMNAQVPLLSLTHGQVVWTLCHGEIPETRQLRLVLNELRYLRQLDVPFAEEKRGKGRGNRIRYRYEELVELGIALTALHRGVRPQLVANFLVTNRTDLRRMYREALEEQPAKALLDLSLNSRTKSISIPADEKFIRLHNRYAETPGKFEIVGPAEAKEFDHLFGMRELFTDGTAEVLVPLTRLVLELTARALAAPMIRPGRRTQEQQSPALSSSVRA